MKLHNVTAPSPDQLAQIRAEAAKKAEAEAAEKAAAEKPKK